MDVIAEVLMDEELQQIQRLPDGPDTVIVFKDGRITAWTEVKVNISIRDTPLVVKQVIRSREWYTIIFNGGDIRISRIPVWPSPECFIYNGIHDPTVMVVDCGDE
ncbi:MULTISPECIES: hypothetical protein [Rhizobium/Agrobacterium group]|uniref:hypothetical protein n=1 Tax=Rhizobium/Agrobacterium group TaxID=227290 RepID=UPI0015736A19|nr:MULTISPECIES: hypothetical protein [Rhizobium/Agrobacterium group]MCF1463835.1 hypothetical protein [Allorhizobium ampelinum]NSZ17404.1 hypothetical protein [Agrobacterium vitis]QZO03107.1 hypothetical protein K4831_11715 [Agrobacterium vitis]UJL88228.1 hypothetical protein AVF2S5_10055 [Agrobacterium vitis]